MSLQIIMSENGERAEGVLIPVKDWKTLEPFVDKESELYSLMERLTKKPPFEMSEEELRDHLKSTADQAKQRFRISGCRKFTKTRTVTVLINLSVSIPTAGKNWCHLILRTALLPS